MSSFYQVVNNPCFGLVDQEVRANRAATNDGSTKALHGMGDAGRENASGEGQLLQVLVEGLALAAEFLHNPETHRRGRPFGIAQQQGDERVRNTDAIQTHESLFLFVDDNTRTGHPGECIGISVVDVGIKFFPERRW